MSDSFKTTTNIIKQYPDLLKLSIMKKEKFALVIFAVLVLLISWLFYPIEFSESKSLNIPQIEKVMNVVFVVAVCLLMQLVIISVLYITWLERKVENNDIPFLCESIMNHGEKGVEKQPTNMADFIPFSWKFDFEGVINNKDEEKEIIALGFKEKPYTSDGLVFRYRNEKNWRSIDELNYKEIHYMTLIIKNRLSI